MGGGGRETPCRRIPKGEGSLVAGADGRWSDMLLCARPCARPEREEATRLMTALHDREDFEAAKPALSLPLAQLDGPSLKILMAVSDFVSPFDLSKN